MALRQFNGHPDRCDTGLDKSKGSTDAISMYCWFKQDEAFPIATLFGRNNFFSGDNRLQFRAELVDVAGNWKLSLDMWGAGAPNRRFCTVDLPENPLNLCLFVAYVNDVTNDRARFYWGHFPETLVEVDVSDFVLGVEFSPTDAAAFLDGSPGVYINIGACGREEPIALGDRENFHGIISTVGIEFDTELSLADLQDRSRDGLGSGSHSLAYFWPIVGTDPEPGIVTVYGTTVVEELRCGEGFIIDSSGPPGVDLEPDPPVLSVTQARKFYVWRIGPEIPDATCTFVPVVRILRGSDFLPVLELDLYSTLRYTRRWTDLDDFDLKFSCDTEQGLTLAQILKPSDGSKQNGKYLVAVAFNQLMDFVGFIDRIKCFKGGGRHEMTISGYGLDRIFSDRVLAPAAGDEFDAYDDPVETIIKTMVDRHIKNPGTFTTLIPGFNEAQREVAALLIATDKELGPTIVYNGRFQRLIDGMRDVIQAAEGELGYTLQLVGGTLLFDVVPGNDRSLSVVFSPDYDNVSEFEWEHDGLNFASHLVMGGQGTGATKLLATVYTPESVRFNIERREAYADVADIDTADKLQDKGIAFLEDKGKVEIVRIKKLPGSRPCYKEDWDLGDFVGLRDAQYGINQASRVMEVTVSCAAGQVTAFDLVLAKASPIGPLSQASSFRQGATGAVARQ